jgi:hypothetical protein
MPWSQSETSHIPLAKSEFFTILWSQSVVWRTSLLQNETRYIPWCQSETSCRSTPWSQGEISHIILSQSEPSRNIWHQNRTYISLRLTVKLKLSPARRVKFYGYLSFWQKYHVSLGSISLGIRGKIHGRRDLWEKRSYPLLYESNFAYLLVSDQNLTDTLISERRVTYPLF